jgi:uncharacterized protein YndB with AHSA1/START domain
MIIRSIVIVVVVIVAGILILAATKPDTFRVQRSAAIKAPPEKIFALIDDFTAWPAWSPWEKKDPAMKRNYGATARGKGAAYAWEGNKDVGQGSMEIAESTPPAKIVLNLNFAKPFEAHNRVEFTLAPMGDTTKVTWEMQGPTPFFAKIIHVFINMDRMVGKDFEAGLVNLKAVAEK